MDALFVHPVKGLSAQPVDRVELRPGKGFPHDRRFAFARPDGRYRPGRHAGLPKQEFYALVSDHRLAGLDTHLDTETDVLTVRVAGHDVLTADLSTEEGRDAAVRFFTRVLDLPAGVMPLLAREPGRRFTDAAAAGDGPMGWISLVNLASVRDLESRTGTVVDPLRFRANVFVDGLPAWSELDTIGRELDLGGVRVRAVHRTRRCAATEVGPATGHRDLPVVSMVHRTYGHEFMGVYLEVLTAGVVAKGSGLVA
ncbi:MOSC domain-containing protein [Actinophytocola sp.]|uniref:MOSC domain-containing protein n=1 Tax=Actinophytocola sp. TaxID=1872138 RepID=UPI002D345890|nr:MOSC N-terminal beta barrel domain-containing protein [Actinophytocola sp.]HYQ69911.1 MOSC N-terminal beta barrel domain-containing protein [Actinophytocola sp.]